VLWTNGVESCGRRARTKERTCRDELFENCSSESLAVNMDQKSDRYSKAVPGKNNRNCLQAVSRCSFDFRPW
jgi:hypothetical protein